jgi:hypothetical protein
MESQTQLNTTQTMKMMLLKMMRAILITMTISKEKLASTALIKILFLQMLTTTQEITQPTTINLKQVMLVGDKTAIQMLL